jgi:NTP pyrophosphatase (non-canonical NTP hydrolase)
LNFSRKVLLNKAEPSWELILMGLGNLLRFIETEDEKLKKRYSRYVNEEEVILARTVKLGEEFGELCEEVLAYNLLQRKQKLDNCDKENLPEEFADVIITTLLLAKTMNVDVEKALEEKMQKLNHRV